MDNMTPLTKVGVLRFEPQDIDGYYTQEVVGEATEPERLCVVMYRGHMFGIPDNDRTLEKFLDEKRLGKPEKATPKFSLSRNQPNQ